MLKFGPTQIAASLLLVGSLLIGLSFAALMPPFEGFDEPAHYSYIEQIAETGTWPRRNDPIAKDVVDYQDVAPIPALPYARWSYRTFFAAPPEIIARGRAAAFAPRDPSRPWRAAVGQANWEAQHPPLYYALSAPAFKLTSGWSLEQQLFLLRAISYLIAWLALCIVAFSPPFEIARDATDRTMIALAPALWPALIPMWFAEMARLGNDCLIAFLAACTVVLISRTDAKRGVLNYLPLGVVCALGLVTKATFLPVAAAAFLLLCYRAWIARRDKPDVRAHVRGLALFAAVITVISGWWYGENLYYAGTFIGSGDSVGVGKQSFLSLALSSQTLLSPRSLYLLFVSAGKSFLWDGTWSFTTPPLIFELPIAILLVFVAAGYLRALVRPATQSFEWFLLLTLAFFMAGLVQEALFLFVEHHTIAIPSWYLHSLAPILAPILGRGLAEATRWRIARPIIGPLLIYPLLFLPFVTGILALHYAGCSDRSPTTGGYDFSSVSACIANPAGILQNLATLSDPLLFLALFAAGWILMLSGTVLSVRIWTATGRATERRRSEDSGYLSTP